MRGFDIREDDEEATSLALKAEIMWHYKMSSQEYDRLEYKELLGLCAKKEIEDAKQKKRDEIMLALAKALGSRMR